MDAGCSGCRARRAPFRARAGVLIAAASLALACVAAPAAQARHHRHLEPLARALATRTGSGIATVSSTTLAAGRGGYAALDTGTVGSIALAAGSRSCSRPLDLRLRIDGRSLPAITLPASGALQRVRERFLLGAGPHRLFVRSTRGSGCAVRLRSLVLHAPAIPLGAAVRQSALGDAGYAQAFVQDFDSMTPENELKMDHLEPREGVFSFAGADRMVDWARAQGKAIRGHTLVWGHQLPQWMTHRLLPLTRQQVATILEQYVRTVVRHFAGRVFEWDVVNEAFDGGGNYVPNIWYEALGPDYIPLAFRWAHEADPNARLVYNDIGAESPGLHLDAILRMVSSLKAQGIRIDAVGFQNHIDPLGPPPVPGALERSMRMVAAKGIGVEITEMDVPMTLGALGGSAGRDAQARVFGEAAAECRAVPACQRFTVWGVDDGLSWRGPFEQPLLLDSSYREKPAYLAVRDQLALR